MKKGSQLQENSKDLTALLVYSAPPWQNEDPSLAQRFYHSPGKTLARPDRHCRVGKSQLYLSREVEGDLQDLHT